jgi:hypothetical protein
MLVAATYEGSNETVYEWECTRPGCGKIVQRGRLKEEDPTEWETLLHEFCKREHAKDRRRNNQNSRRPHKLPR